MKLDDRPISDELLNAFVDEQLDADERGSVLDRLQGDKELARRACELRHLKDLSQHAYNTQLPVPTRRKAGAHGGGLLVKGLAASVILGLGVLLGWFAHGRLEPDNGIASIMHLNQAGQLQAIRHQATVQHVILQLSTGDPRKVNGALDEAEDLIKAYHKARKKLQLEVLTNAGGLDLLRSDVSPAAARVQQLMKEYKNITFMACSQTIEHLRERGIKVKLLPHTKVVPSALQEIVHRLKEGWVYIKA